jgi:hypothetical protein
MIVYLLKFNFNYLNYYFLHIYNMYAIMPEDWTSMLILV